MSLSHGAAAPPEEALAALTGPSAPCLIGVRHHAPSLAAAVPALLDEAKPDVLLVELPAETQEWLPWLGHEETRAPVALAAAPGEGDGGRRSTRSPTSRPNWPPCAGQSGTASRSSPATCRSPTAPGPADAGPRGGTGAPGLAAALRTRLTGRAGDDLWDRFVEATAPGSPPEALRRAALLTGWALREDAVASGGVPELDLRREAWMRARLAEATAGGERAAVVVGAFHAPALVRRDAGEEDAAPPADPHRTVWNTSLIPYTYALLDERSGYPAGIRDPEWQDMVLRAAGDPAALEETLTRAAVRVCAELRGLGHPSGPADAREISRLASDLARLRGLPAAGRGELVEAVQTVLAQGEPYGRGRAVARAMERVLVGTRTGRPAPGAPRSGLVPAVEAEVSRLGLPGPGTDGSGTPRDLRLDPLRSDLDRRRELLLRRLTVCGVPYGEAKEVVGAGGAEALTSRWEVRWTPATAAVLTTAGVRGVTSAQAAEGVLRERRRKERDDGGPTAAQALDGLAQAAECGLTGLADERIGDVAGVLPGAGTLPELLAALALLDRLRAGHVPGLPAEPDREDRAAATAELITAAAVRQVDGLTGSEDPADAHALLELAHRADALGGIRLTDALSRLAADGSPLMRGAAGAVRVLLGHEDARAFGDRVASWADAATGPDSRAALTARLTGLLTAAGPLLEAAAPALEPLLTRVTELPDRAFLDRLPALRGGFDTLSPAARDRLFAAVEERLGTRPVAGTDDVDPAALALWTEADFTARETLRSQGLLPAPGGGPAARDTADTTEKGAPEDAEERRLLPADRWRLLLGRRADRLPASAAPWRPRWTSCTAADAAKAAAATSPAPEPAADGRRRTPVCGSGPRNWPRCSGRASGRKCSRPPPRPAARTSSPNWTRTAPGPRWTCCAPCSGTRADCPRPGLPPCARSYGGSSTR
ncbi:hypothetical protein SHKM778_50600 [Streptomyces sp. KM77-8]|uniref:Uncharacterized protein n=1 Tax=Streptomyces haneummycinicus TaxID=3074435 RepID=A0AAT9HMM6_9ACTN